MSALETLRFVAKQAGGTRSRKKTFDNDPPEIGVDDDGLSPHRVQHQVSGFPRRGVPPGCEVLTMGLTLGSFFTGLSSREADGVMSSTQDFRSRYDAGHGRHGTGDCFGNPVLALERRPATLTRR